MFSSHAFMSLLARVLMAAIFIMAGIEKIKGYEGSAAYMQSFGVPGSLLPVVIFAELAGGLAILFGVFARTAAVGLALFCLVSGAIFHSNFSGDGAQTQIIMFMKNLAMAGGFLLLAANGPGRLAIMK